MEAARALARAMHKHNITLVYGGGTVGLMGEIAKTLVSLSGPSSVHGIIPTPLLKWERTGQESGVNTLPDDKVWGRTTVVKDMHTRKKMMAEEVMKGASGSGFVGLAGGYGTLEELMEMTTWNQLGIHDVGICLYNVDGYWDGLLSWVEGAVKGGFVSRVNGGIMAQATSAEGVIKRLQDYKSSSGRFALDWANN
jgi:uncharacterized protein (TIGR00730 family)